MADLLARVVEALSRTDEDGNDLFPAEQVRHALPYLVFSLELPLDELSEGLQELVVEVAVAAGASTTDPGAALDAILRWYQAHPVDAGVVAAVRQSLEAEAPPALTAKAAAALGVERRSSPLDAGGPRPAGTIPAALARVRTTPKKPPSR